MNATVQFGRKQQCTKRLLSGVNSIEPHVPGPIPKLERESNDRFPRGFCRGPAATYVQHVAAQCCFHHPCPSSAVQHHSTRREDAQTCSKTRCALRGDGGEEKATYKRRRRQPCGVKRLIGMFRINFDVTLRVPVTPRDHQERTLTLVKAMTLLQATTRCLATWNNPLTLRGFSSSAARWANRAVVYKSPGDPKSVLSALTYPDLPSPPSQSVNVRFLLSPINPSDINVIEGVYPAKPQQTNSFAPGHKLDEPVFTGGNEGLAEVTEVGSGVEGVKKGDWVIMAGQQLGTWSTTRTLKADQVIKLPGGISEVTGATMMVSTVTGSSHIQTITPSPC